MTVVIQRRKATEYAVPNNGEILWYGVAASVPSGFGIDVYCDNVFIQGCAAGAATNTQAGENSHQHTNPSVTGSQADHTHSLTGGDTGSASGTIDTYPQAIVNSASSSHVHDIPSGTSGAGGTHSHTLSSTVVADAYPPYARLYWIKNTSGDDAGLPVNGIVMWDDAIADAPSGFALCNGSGGTIDLQDKFVYGAAADDDVGDTGGAETHTHGNADASTAGTHSHSISLTAGATDSTKNVSGYTGGETVSKGGHTHSLTGTTNADSNHTHTLSDTGSGSSLPPYLMLYFIQRVS